MAVRFTMMSGGRTQTMTCPANDLSGCVARASARRRAFAALRRREERPARTRAASARRRGSRTEPRSAPPPRAAARPSSAAAGAGAPSLCVSRRSARRDRARTARGSWSNSTPAHPRFRTFAQGARAQPEKRSARGHHHACGLGAAAVLRVVRHVAPSIESDVHAGLWVRASRARL